MLNVYIEKKGEKLKLVTITRGKFQRQILDDLLDGALVFAPRESGARHKSFLNLIKRLSKAGHIIMAIRKGRNERVDCAFISDEEIKDCNVFYMVDEEIESEGLKG